MFDSEGMLRKPDPDSSSKVSSDGPFFTVLVPTMNRANLLAAAVRTVMWQTFTDFELIVSDNSNDEEARAKNRAAIEEYAEDPRVHYIRPDRWMNMPDHWEFATRHASGRYVVILTDRHVMRPSALEFLHARIGHLQEDSRVISWRSDSSFNGTGIAHTGTFTGATDVLDSKQEIREFARCANWKSSAIWSNRLPRMLNGCYRFDVAQGIREKHGRLFFPLNPDYTVAYLLLAYTATFSYLDRPLFMCHGNQGNGRHSLVHGGEAYLSTLGDVDLHTGTPSLLDTVTNGIVRDLMMAKHLVGQSYADISVDLVGYFLCNYREMLVMERYGSQRNVRALYTQWWEEIQMLTPGQQKQIRQYVCELDSQRASFTGLRRLAVRLGLDRLCNSTAGRIRQVRHRLAGKPVYADVFEAARQTDCMLTDSVETANGIDQAANHVADVNCRGGTRTLSCGHKEQ